MTNYNKMKNADLAILCKLRGLPNDGSKIQMVARLVRQDKADDDEAKAIEARVKATSSGYRAANEDNSAASTTLTKSKKNKKKGKSNVNGTFPTNAAKAAFASSSTAAGQEAPPTTASQDDIDTYINSLIGETAPQPSAPTRGKILASAPPSPMYNPAHGIIVNMTKASREVQTPRGTLGKTTAGKAYSTGGSSLDKKSLASDKAREYKGSWVTAVAGLVTLVGILTYALGAWSMEDFSAFANSVQAGAKDPVRTVKEAIWGREPPPGWKYFAQRVYELGVVLGKKLGI